MSLIIVQTNDALRDVIEIADYLAEVASLDTSDNFLSAAKKAFQQLADMPGMGALRDYAPDLAGLRQWPVPAFTNYLIFYTATETEIRVLRIIHGSQNIKQIFSPSE